MIPVPTVGLALLTGGQGRRLGGPKHVRPHPSGGSWGAHLVAVFEAVFPEGPRLLLGAPLPDRPDLPCLPDDGLGPARALIHWAALEAPPTLRWWVVACDMVRWEPPLLAAWARRAVTADPEAHHWVVGRSQGRLQPLGGFLPQQLRRPLADQDQDRLGDLVRSLPHRVLPWEGPAWRDIDDPEDLASWIRP